MKILKLRGVFRSDLRGLLYYYCVRWIFSSFYIAFPILLTIDVSWPMKLAQTKNFIVK